MSISFWIFVVLVLLAAGVFIFRLLREKRRILASLSIGDSANLTVNTVMLVLTLISIVIAIAAFQDSKNSGVEQQKALDASRQSLQDVVSDLRKQNALLREAQNTLQSQLEVSQAQQQALTATIKILEGTKSTLRSQLAIVAEQNKRELERLRRQPRVRFSLAGLTEDRFSEGLEVSTVEDAITHQKGQFMSLTVTNIGDEALMNPRLQLTYRQPPCMA
jgi:type II secretory pathway pseudopilin PulG